MKNQVGDQPILLVKGFYNLAFKDELVNAVEIEDQIFIFSGKNN